mmetsp:Transcript_131766/g.381064  ORF Transcript_131766/g.381064 Transcript_131766/m.381064 type:complete len:227 (+) Transcript_131766:506-1186(+)
MGAVRDAEELSPDLPDALAATSEAPAAPAASPTSSSGPAELKKVSIRPWSPCKCLQIDLRTSSCRDSAPEGAPSSSSSESSKSSPPSPPSPPSSSSPPCVPSCAASPAADGTRPSGASTAALNLARLTIAGRNLPNSLSTCSTVKIASSKSRHRRSAAWVCDNAGFFAKTRLILQTRSQEPPKTSVRPALSPCNVRWRRSRNGSVAESRFRCAASVAVRRCWAWAA